MMPPFFKVPWYTRIYVSWPYRPSSSLKASPSNGAFAAGDRGTAGEDEGRFESYATVSAWAGLGRYAHTPSSKGWTPVFLIADPKNTGENLRPVVARRMAAAI